MNKKVNDLNRKTVSEKSFYGSLCGLKGGLGVCHQQAKRGRSPPAPQEFFGTYIYRSMLASRK